MYTVGLKPSCYTELVTLFLYVTETMNLRLFLNISGFELFKTQSNSWREK